METLATTLSLGLTPVFGTVLFAIETPEVIAKAGHLVYALLAYLAFMGMYYSILLFRRTRQKRFASVDAGRDFLTVIRECLRTEKYDDAIKMCDSPQYWRIAVPQLVAHAIKNRKDPLPRLKRDLEIGRASCRERV